MALKTPILPGVRIGHVHLKVSELERALGFYCGVLGFKLMQRYGRDAAFISAGGYHHHIGLNTWALYLSDPDENGVELYVDRPKPQWPRDGDGNLEMFSRALDLESLLREPATS